MYIIDASYYSKAPWVIANIVMEPKSAMEVAAAKVVNDLIGYYHDKFIRQVLGSNAVNVIDELKNNGSLDGLSDEVKAIAEKLREPFGAFIYFHVLRHAQSVNGITGVYQLVSSDKSISPRHMQMQAWNSMVGSLKALSLEMGWEVDCNLVTPVNIFNI